MATAMASTATASWLTMRVRIVAIVDARLEGLHALPREERPLEAADQLLGLAAEHRAGDDLDGAR